jgi:transglutaminase-like putative cysteine protease
VAPLAAGAVFLALIVAGSTAQADWVAGSAVLPSLALVAALAACLLAVMGVRPRRAVALTALLAPVAGYYSAAAARAVGAPGGGDLIMTWWRAFITGRAADNASFLLFVLCVLFWLLVTWLVWGVLRRRQPLLAVAPAGAALSTNVLNFPNGQDAFVFWFLVVAFALLLWSTYQSSLSSAVQHRVGLAEGARWDFWERGAVAMAALVALGVLAPPLSGVDQTLSIENNLARSWGQITHANGSGPGSPQTTSVGLTRDAPLSGSLKLTHGVVFTYTAAENAVAPSYFRGFNLSPAGSEWRFEGYPQLSLPMRIHGQVDYSETYAVEQRTSYQVTMLHPPAEEPHVIVYPGQLASVDRDVQLLQYARPRLGLPSFDTVDQVVAPNARGVYRVEVDQSTATVDDLRGATSRYPPWIQQYIGLPANYRTPDVRREVHDLAVQVTAGAANPYDQATAIETYLRQNYSYKLEPGLPWQPGQDTLEYFLFTNKAGTCPYFATAMADMLRSIGVPTRLVNGYGPGQYDQKHNQWVVRESDTHTWPEVYFANYGWITFEPTPDPAYPTIQRGAASGGSSDTSGAASVVPTPAAAPTRRPDRNAAGPATGRRLELPSLRTWTPVAAVLLFLAVMLYVAASRYLRPQTVAGVWSRAVRLTWLAGVRSEVGDTPIEFGDRVAGEFPEAAAGMRQLAVDFAVAAYAPRGLAEQRKPAVMAGWAALRPLLLRRVASRLVPERIAHARQASTASPV